jgi:large subunit ribosomal protein L2
VVGIHYDPRRTARLALINPIKEEHQSYYMIAAEGIQVGDSIEVGNKASVSRGSTITLEQIPIGTDIYCVEIHPGEGAKLVRSAGTKATLLRKEADSVVVRLPSGERRQRDQTCTAVVGQVSCADHLLEVVGKAGRNRNKG